MLANEEREQLAKDLEGIKSDALRVIPPAICNLLIGKGLSFRQALALLDYAKDLLRDAKI